MTAPMPKTVQEMIYEISESSCNAQAELDVLRDIISAARFSSETGYVRPLDMVITSHIIFEKIHRHMEELLLSIESGCTDLKSCFQEQGEGEGRETAAAEKE